MSKKPAKKVAKKTAPKKAARKQKATELPELRLPNTRIVDITEVKRNPKNPRKITDAQYFKLIDSIKKNPNLIPLRPIVVDDKMTAVGGNQRLRALGEVGYRQVVITDASNLTQEEIDDFVIVDNLPYGEWDKQKLFEQYTEEKLKAFGLELAAKEKMLKNPNPEMPIVAKWDEKHEAVIIVISNETDLTFIQTVLSLGKRASYKNKNVGTTFVITAEEFIKQWKSK